MSALTSGAFSEVLHYDCLSDQTEDLESRSCVSIAVTPGSKATKLKCLVAFATPEHIHGCKHSCNGYNCDTTEESHCLGLQSLCLHLRSLTAEQSCLSPHCCCPGHCLPLAKDRKQAPCFLVYQESPARHPLYNLYVASRASPHLQSKLTSTSSAHSVAVFDKLSCPSANRTIRGNKSVTFCIIKVSF